MIELSKLEALYELNKYDAVISQCIENLYKEDDEQETLYYYLIASFLAMQRYPEAMGFCKEAEGKYPGSSLFIYLHSKALLGLGENKQAAQYIEKALSMEPNRAQYYAQYCQILMEQQKFPKAKKMIDKALELECTEIKYHLANALVIYMLGGEKIAKEIIEEVLKKEPHNEDALYLKQGIFTSRLKEKKSILKGLLARNPLDEEYQKKFKFITFYYRYIPALMVLNIGLSFLLHTERSSFGFLEPWLMLSFFITGAIGSHDWRFNVVFIASLLGINTYFTNIPDGLEFVDILAIVLLSGLYSWVLNGLYYAIRAKYKAVKEKYKQRVGK